MQKNSPLPQYLQSALFSYKLDKLDPIKETDKKIIITNVLNHGTDQQVQWLLNYYSPHDIKKVLKDPSKGSWWPESLNYWLIVYDVSIESDMFHYAIQNIYPQT